MAKKGVSKKNKSKAKQNTLVLIIVLFLILMLIFAIFLRYKENSNSLDKSSSGLNLSNEELSTEEDTEDKTAKNNAEKFAMKRICRELNINAEFIQSDSNSEVLKIDCITPGLDTYNLNVVMYSLKTDKILGQKDFKEGDFTTGILNDGFYVSYNKTGKIEFYGNDCQIVKTVKLNREEAKNTVCTAVSKNGNYVCFVNGKTSGIYLYNISQKTYVKTGGFSEHISLADTSDTAFYFENKGRDIIVVNAKTQKQSLHKFNGMVRDISKYGAVKQTDADNDASFKTVNIDGTLDKSFKANSVSETFICRTNERIVTVSENQSGDTLTFYKKDNSYARYFINERVYNAFGIDDDNFVVTTIKSTEKSVTENPKIYLLNIKNLNFLKYDTSSTQKVEVNKSEEVDLTEKSETPENNTKIIKNVPVISQFPEYPTGCESVSAVIAMKYSKENISVKTFVNKYLSKSNNFYFSGGTKYGPDPSEYFIGNPKTKNSYGCMAPVIEKAINKYYKENGSNGKKVLNLTGSSMSDLCKKYIDNDIPCMVWVSIGMKKPYYTSVWTLENGGRYTWLANEHCSVLIGYDDKYYYFSDPYKGAVVKYEKNLCESRYNAFKKQALAIK